MNDNDLPIKCKCSECGKIFIKGDQEDNEELCLRCEHYGMISEDSEEYFDDIE